MMRGKISVVGLAISIWVVSCGDDDAGSGTTTGTGNAGAIGGSGAEGGTGAIAGAGGTGGSPRPGCGDGEVVAPEVCDDENAIDNDGCDADCQPSAVTAIAAAPQHTCALTRTGAVRCWGNGAAGRLGYASNQNIGDTETPASAGDVDVGGVVTQIAVGEAHTCALLEGGAVRCWGNGGLGRLGYGNVQSVGDKGTPASAGDVDVGGEVTQVSAGADHTCALLASGDVRCWGGNADGQLGQGNQVVIGDTETPASVAVVDLGGATAVAVAAGYGHTCVLLQGGSVRCWGSNSVGQIGTGVAEAIGDDEPPLSVPVVDVGFDVVEIAAVYGSTCVRSAAGAIRCWGFAGNGECGYGNTEDIGDDEVPSSAGDIQIGGIVTQVNAGPCALLDTGRVRCWGLGATGALGHGNLNNIGDNETPDTAGDIDLGGDVVFQHSDGIHACAILATGAVRCWGLGTFGMLGYGSTATIGDNELPASAGDVIVFESATGGS